MKKKRKLYKIGQVADLLGITHRTIRYYNQLGLLPHVKRTDGSIRLFDNEDIKIIKKIRRMQKEQFLPLEVIKERLFDKHSGSNQQVIVLTDDSATLSKTARQELPIKQIFSHFTIGSKPIKTETQLRKSLSSKRKKRPTIEAPNKTDFVNIYTDLKNQGYTKIYSLHSSQHLSSAFNNASKAAQQLSSDIDIDVIDTKSTGPSLGLCVELIAESINKNETQEETSILIEKIIPLLYQIGFINNTRYLLEKQDKDTSHTQKTIIKNMASFKPIFVLKDAKGILEVDACCKDNDSAIKYIIQHVQDEIETRGNYLNQIKIGYSFLYSEAQTLANKLKALYPHSRISIEEILPPLSIEFSDCVSMSIV